MNKKEECEIVKDLAVQYIEKSLNEGSQNFVKNHLETCEDCRKYYKTIEDTVCNESEQDKIVKKQFKKVHKRINILKIILVVILIIILIAGLVVWYKEATFSNLVNKVSEKVEYMESLDNYKITVKTINKDFKKESNSWEFEETYYYKDGKLKNESNQSIFFYEDDSYDSIYVFHDLRQIEYCHSNYIKKRKGSAVGVFSYIKENYKPIASTIYSLAFSVREDRFNGIECYVIRFGDRNSYRDIWVDKSTYITVREVNESYSHFYKERVFTFEENVVTDADVDSSILNLEEYNDYTKMEVNTKIPQEQVEIIDAINAQ